jgi:hypothetical protein
MQQPNPKEFENLSEPEAPSNQPSESNSIEERDYQAGLLENADRQSHRRDQELYNLSYSVGKFSIVVAFVVFLLIALIRVLHLLLPTGWTWMEGDQIESVDSLLNLFYGGAIGSFLTKFVENHLAKKRNRQL